MLNDKELLTLHLCMTKMVPSNKSVTLEKVKKSNLIYLVHYRNNHSNRLYPDALYWFVLSSKALACYHNGNHNDEIFTLSLDAYKMSVSEENNSITLDLAKPDSVGYDCKKLQLHCKDDDAFDARIS